MVQQRFLKIIYDNILIQAEAKGFGMTLRGSCDFKLEDFFAGPAEMFEPHYGEGSVYNDMML
jgi:hypothetical protein